MAFSAQDLKDALFKSHFVTIKSSNSNNKNLSLGTSNTQSKVYNQYVQVNKQKKTSNKIHKQNSKLNSEKIKVKLKKKTACEKLPSNKNIKSLQGNIWTGHTNLKSHKNNSIDIKEKVLKENMNKNNLVADNPKTPLHSAVDFKKLVQSLENETDDDKKCLNILNLAQNCISKESFSEFQESGSLNTVFQLFSGSHDSISLVLCHSLLLCSLSRHSLTVDEIKIVEDSILLMLKYIAVPKYENGTYESVEANCMQMLSQHLQDIARELCVKILPEGVDSVDVNISTLCCISLKNLAMHTKEYYNIGISYCFGPETINYVVGMTGKATQEIISEDPSSLKESKICACTATHTINQCLQVLEYALYINPDEQISSLHRDNISFPHCLTRLLGWCITSLFQTCQSNDTISSSSTQSSLSPLYLSTLVSILKVLSSLTHNADSFAKLGNVKGLMEKVMICTLKIYFESADHQFEVLVLCLELMINLYLTDQKTFLRLCLKKFKVGGCDEMLSIEALIKILSNNLDKIKQVQDVNSLEKKTNEQNSSSVHNNDIVRRAEDSQMQLVLKAADKDMELSTLCSYICVLLVFFVDTKQSFKEFIQERLPLEITTDAISESRRVLEFASLTGGMSKCGILMLQHTIRILQSMHQPD